MLFVLFTSYGPHDVPTNLPLQALLGERNAGFAGNGLLDLGDAKGAFQ